MSIGDPFAASPALGGMAGRKGGVNSISFTLPSLPGSVNLIYGPRRTVYSNNGWGLRDEWLIWSTKMMPHVLLLPRSPAKSSIIRVDRCYFYPWFTKDGQWRRVDTSNMDKLLFDTIAKKTGINDLYFKQGLMDSCDDPSGKVLVTLTEIPEQQWKRGSNGRNDG